MNSENRPGMKSAPVDLEYILTPVQLMTLRIAVDLGWELYFVKQDGLETPRAGIWHANKKINGVIDEDGNLNINPTIKTRINPESPQRLYS